MIVKRVTIFLSVRIAERQCTYQRDTLLNTYLNTFHPVSTNMAFLILFRLMSL